ncbi:hypothetical protein CBR_g3990 [Chara braunii]|uniref:Uncharacterized protein n=1 Tax=Chara braunii TaxID=69332 RepID=A0A388KGX5_CHABU|nr:hypothetical protein CBR_g3990 [Chara braunii]|eukprot:GBG69291.1 hypothetical protein CBR_g3990 [Chara braunii]
MAPRTVGNRDMGGNTGPRLWGHDNVERLADRRLGGGGGGGGGGGDIIRREEDDEQRFRRMMAEAFGEALREAASIRSESIERRRRAAEEGAMEVAAEVYHKLCFDFPLVSKDELSALAIVLRKQLASQKRMPFPLTSQFASGVSYLVTSPGSTASRGAEEQLAGLSASASEASGDNRQQEAQHANRTDDIQHLAQKVFMCVFVKLPAICLSAWRKGDPNVMLQAFEKYHPPCEASHVPSEEAGFSGDDHQQCHLKSSTKGEEQQIRPELEPENKTNISEDGGDAGSTSPRGVEACHQLAEEEDDDGFEFEPMEDAILPQFSGRTQGAVSRSTPERESRHPEGFEMPGSSMTLEGAAFRLADLSSYVRYDVRINHLPL